MHFVQLTVGFFGDPWRPIGIAPDNPVCIGDEHAFAQIQEDEPILPRVGDDRAASDWDVEWLDDDSPARFDDRRGRFIGRRHEQVDFHFWSLGLNDDFSVGVGHAEARCHPGSPDQLVSEPVPVKSKPRLEIRHRDPQTIDFAEKWSNQLTASVRGSSTSEESSGADP